MMNGVNIGAEQVGSTLHWGPYWPINGYEKTSWSRNSVPGYNQLFHVYGVEWTPGKRKSTLKQQIMHVSKLPLEHALGEHC